MAQQVGGAVALDALTSSVSYRRTTPWKEPLKKKSEKSEDLSSSRTRLIKGEKKGKGSVKRKGKTEK